MIEEKLIAKIMNKYHLADLLELLKEYSLELPRQIKTFNSYFNIFFIANQFEIKKNSILIFSMGYQTKADSSEMEPTIFHIDFKYMSDINEIIKVVYDKMNHIINKIIKGAKENFTTLENVEKFLQM